MFRDFRLERFRNVAHFEEKEPFVAPESSVGHEDRIGIIGASGAIGSMLVGELAALGFRDIVLFSRELQRACDAVNRHRSENACQSVCFLARPLDVLAEDTRAVAEKIADCAIVIHAAAPSWRTSAPSAQAARCAGAHYIDLGGFEMLMTEMQNWDLGEFAKNRAFIGSAGLMPGLSELFARFVADWAERSGAEICRVDIACGAQEAWSDGSVEDILWHLDHHRDSGWHDKGVWKRTSILRAIRKLPVSSPLGDGLSFAIPNPQLAAWSARRPVLRITTWMGLLGARTIFAIVVARILIRLNHDWALRRLKDALLRDCASYGRQATIEVMASRAQGDIVCSGLFRERRSEWITAGVVGLTAAFIADGRVRFGANYLADAVDHAEFIGALTRRGVAFDLRHSITPSTTK